MTAETTTRSLPVHVRPLAGESFTSVVERIAWAHGINTSDLLAFLDIGTRSSDSGRQLSSAPATLSATVAEAFRTRTGLDADTLAPTLLSRWDGTAISLAGMHPEDPVAVTKVKSREWAYFDRSQACPDCLAADEGWQLSWRLPWAFSCERHRRLLVSECLSCSMPLQPNNRIHVAADPRPTWACGQRTDQQTCGADLRVAPPGAEVPDELREVQERVLAPLEGQPTTVIGEPASPSEWFAMLRSMSVLLFDGLDPATLPAWTPEPCARSIEEHRSENRQRAGKKGRAKRPLPASAPLFAAVLAKAVDVLDAPTEVDAAELLAPMCSYALEQAGTDVAFRLLNDTNRRVPEPLRSAIIEARRAAFGLTG